MNRKIMHITRLLRQRDELTGRIARIDAEIDRAWHGRVPSSSGRRGAPPKYGKKDKTRVLALARRGLSERKIAQITGIPHATVGSMIKRK